jgi:hypothetical protein
MRGVILWLATAALLAAVDRAPIASSPVVTVRGVIEKVQVTPGAGMPMVEVRTNGKTTTVRLGSMRYLMEKNFQPKSGEEISVRGYQSENEVIAIEATMPASKTTLKFRDENGWPLWRGGRRDKP